MDRRTAISNLVSDRFKALLYSVAILLAVPQGVEAAILVESWKPIFQGIDYATGSSDASEPRLQKVNALRIDLFNPEIAFFSTPSNRDAELETFGQTTSDFLVSSGVQVAVNANFFAPCCAAAPEPKDLLGLAISKGEIVSPPDEIALPQNELAGSLLIGQDNRSQIVKTSVTDDFSNVFTAVSASPRLLLDGQITVDFNPIDAFAGLNPRTAVGLSQDEQYLILITIDGRQPGFSEGATLYETAEWLTRFGSFQGLNLDGGGSTTMVRQDEFGNPQLLNNPSGQERFNGNNFGVFAKSIPVGITPIPEPQPPLALFVASFLAYMVWQRRNK
ncbi:hypothetical protein F7734_23655 [Scytonema sp. UIC 10036]|nr:phosphodiester glycosidase family protein [Scytonema sp. UIC 10036]MUG95190.1 hypothetical protein [Scytonema sp. UIC 10036]